MIAYSLLSLPPTLQFTNLKLPVWVILIASHCYLDKGLHCNSQNSCFPKIRRKSPWTKPNMKKCRQAYINGSTELKAELIVTTHNPWIRFSNDILRNLDLEIKSNKTSVHNCGHGLVSCIQQSYEHGVSATGYCPVKYLYQPRTGPVPSSNVQHLWKIKYMGDALDYFCR